MDSKKGREERESKHEREGEIDWERTGEQAREIDRLFDGYKDRQID